jgi:hypothetical protein
MQNFRADAEIVHAKFVNLLSPYVIAAFVTMSQYRGESPNRTIRPFLVHAEVSGTDRSENPGAAPRPSGRQNFPSSIN